MFCDMYLIPYQFVDNALINFPKNYKKKFKTFKNGDDILIAYGETMILLQMWYEEYQKRQKRNPETEQILRIKKQLTEECFITPHQSIMFHSEMMTEQFNYIYYLISKNYQTFKK